MYENTRRTNGKWVLGEEQNIVPPIQDKTFNQLKDTC